MKRSTRFAAAAGTTQERVVFNNANRAVVYNASGSTTVIKKLLELCIFKKMSGFSELLRKLKGHIQQAALMFMMALSGFLLLGVAADRALAWEFLEREDATSDKVKGFAFDHGPNGALISFVCEPNKLIEDFAVGARASDFDVMTDSAQKVVWRIDNEDARKENWFSASKSGVALSFGEPAFNFALAVARAQKRVVFRNHDRTVTFGVSGSTKAIKQLLEYCGLKQ